MLIRIENQVLEKYPRMEIGYLVAKVSVKKIEPFIESQKQKVVDHLQGLGINATNFAAHPNIAIWRKIYEEDFGVNPRTYRSSIEALVRRIATGKELWTISSIVDLYNVQSAFSLLPMGGYDVSKICGSITLRYAQENETFQGIGGGEKISTKSNQIVYADDKRIICWLWNYKDSIETCIDDETKEVLFFVDSAEPIGEASVANALGSLAQSLEAVGCATMASGVLSREVPGCVIA